MSNRALRWAAPLALLAGAACSGDPGSKAEAHLATTEQTVEVKDNAFAPATVSIDVSGTVTWVFADGAVEHHVLGDNGAFESEDQRDGQFAYTFTKVGTYGYGCTIHPAMRGTVTVR